LIRLMKTIILILTDLVLHLHRQPSITDETVEEAISALYEELSKEQNQSQLFFSNELSEDFIIEVTRFCIQFVKTFLKEADCDNNDAVFYLAKLKDRSSHQRKRCWQLPLH